jgi:hypothetical protein
MTAPKFDHAAWDHAVNPLENARQTMHELDRLKLSREVALVALSLAETYGAPGEIIARLRKIANQNKAS